MRGRTTQGNQLTPRRVPKVERSGPDRGGQSGGSDNLLPDLPAPRYGIQSVIGTGNKNECGCPGIFYEVAKPRRYYQIVTRLQVAFLGFGLRSTGSSECIDGRAIQSDHNGSPQQQKYLVEAVVLDVHSEVGVVAAFQRQNPRWGKNDRPGLL